MAQLISLRRYIDHGVTPDMTIIDAKNIRITNAGGIFGGLFLLPWLPISIAAGQPANALQNGLAVLALFAVVWLNRRCWHQAAATVLLLVTNLQIVWAVYWFGEPAGVLLHLPALILLPYVSFRRRSRPLAHAFAIYALLALVGFTVFREDFPVRLALLSDQAMTTVNTFLATLAILLLAALFMNMVDETEDGLERERARADRLLLNVLPPAIVARLKTAPADPIADRYDAITVLFADIVGSTPLSARLSPVRIVGVLNELFTAFDEICDAAGVEKIRTIGDGYMAVCGAPEPNADHAVVMTRVALAMRDYMAARGSDVPLQIRIGLNSGEAVAGIVGTARFHYDVWGDAVNVAARMESTGEPGRVHVGRATWELIKDQFDCESRGRIPVKGKGEMETWFVLGAR